MNMTVVAVAFLVSVIFGLVLETAVLLSATRKPSQPKPKEPIDRFIGVPRQKEDFQEEYDPDFPARRSYNQGGRA